MVPKNAIKALSWCLLTVVLIISHLLPITSASSNSDTTPSSTCTTVPQVPTVTLSNGVEMPAIAAGMAFLDPKDAFYPEQAYRSMALSLEAGMRHIDTALIYRTHRIIGQVRPTP